MPIEIEGPDGVVYEFPDGTPQATMAGAMRKRYPAPKTVPAFKPKGQGSYAAPFDLSGGQSRTAIPKGSYYRDPKGNIRLNENADAGNPIVTAPRKTGTRGKGVPFLNEAAGLAANFNRRAGIGDEFTAGLGTVADLVTGKVRPRVVEGEAPVGLSPLMRGVGDAFARNMDTAQRVEDDARERRPLVAGAAGGLGTTATIMVPMGAMPAAATRMGAAAQGALVGATQGSVMGALDRGSMAERGQSALTGGLVGGLTGGALGGALGGKRIPKPPRPKAVPNAADLRVQTRAAYKAADDAGVTYAPQALDDLADRITAKVGEFRINPARHPKAASMLEDINGLRGEPMTLTQLDQLRQIVRRDVANAPDEAERFFGQKMIDEIDDFIAGSPMVNAGSADDAASLINNARDLNTRFRKVQSVEDATGRAVRRAGSTGSGGNEDNAIRQNIRALREKGRNFSPEEIAAMDDIIMGTPGQNALRLVGKLSPQGSGLMAAGNLGAAAVAGPLGAVPGAAGMVSKFAADRITRQKVDDLLRLMAQGGASSQSAQRELAGLAASDPAVAALVQRLSRAAGSYGATANPPRKVPAQR
jgi:hypothetical protein